MVPDNANLHDRQCATDSRDSLTDHDFIFRQNGGVTDDGPQELQVSLQGLAKAVRS